MTTRKRRRKKQFNDGRVYYVSHPKIHAKGDTWAKRSLSAALKHAREILANNPSRDVACIVQIIRVVRRPRLPMVVEKV